jgi:hypothetical protein
MALKLIEMRNAFPDPIRQGIVDVMWRSSPDLFQLMPFIQHSDLVYRYTEDARLPGVAYRALNADFAASAEGVTNPKVETLAILGGDMTTDSILIGQKGAAARANRIAKKMKAASRRFVRDFFLGDPTVTGHGTEIMGLKKRIGSAMKITNATNGAVPSWKKMVQLQDLVEGTNAEKTLLMNRTTRRLLSEDVAANAGGMGVFDVGKQLAEFNGSKIVEVGKDEAEAEILTFDETCGTSSVTASAYCVRFGSDTDEEYVQGIMGLPERIQHIDVGYTGATYKDVVQMACGVGLFSGYCAARIVGLLAS